MWGISYLFSARMMSCYVKYKMTMEETSAESSKTCWFLYCERSQKGTGKASYM